MWCKYGEAEFCGGTDTCGGGTTPSDWQSEDVEWEPEQITIWSDGQLDSWRGFQKFGTPWLRYSADWDFNSMEGHVRDVEVPVVGSQLTILMISPREGVNKMQIKNWVKECVILLSMKNNVHDWHLLQRFRLLVVNHN